MASATVSRVGENDDGGVSDSPMQAGSCGADDEEVTLYLERVQL